jgi:hypothetical protein
MYVASKLFFEFIIVSSRCEKMVCWPTEKMDVGCYQRCDGKTKIFALLQIVILILLFGYFKGKQEFDVSSIFIFGVGA